MKNLKLLILAFGCLGLVSLFLPSGGAGSPSFVTLYMAWNRVVAIMLIAAFAVPTALVAMGLARPPFRGWQGLVSLAGFGLAAVKLRIWKTLPYVMDAPIAGKLMLIAIVGGLVVSALVVAKLEHKS